ncbi:MAG: DEAD/DEAH box helicase, partial [Myxococcales bacterium]|nr:DEAD/DEAH box helicase [Myxococcales bacterium]
QEQSLTHPAHVVVGTPGRVLQLLQRGSLILDGVRTLVLDEADRMLDMGFIDQIDAIVRHVPRERQTLCFSATLPEGVRALAAAVLATPEHITVDRQHAPGVISHAFLGAAESDKGRATLTLLAQHPLESAIIFCNTKAQCRAVYAALNAAGVHSLAFHGDLDQADRTLVMVRFANQSCRVLVATDVAARGLDIQGLDAVINYDLPFEPQTYVHRVGRTGRAGATGHAFSLVTPGQGARVQAICEVLGADHQTTPAPLDIDGPSPALAPPMVTLSISGGRKAKISAGDVLGALTAKGGVAGQDVGQIDRMEQVTFVAVKRAAAEAALRILRSTPIKGRRFRVARHG